MMDVIDEVRLIAADQDIDEAALARSRDRLERVLAGEPAVRAARPVRPALAIGVGAGAVAAVAATALVVSLWQPAPTTPVAGTHEPTAPESTRAPDPTPSHEDVETADGVLERMAVLAPASAGSQIAAGRYLKLESRVEQLVLANATQAFDVPRDAATSGWVVASTYTTYIPADRSAEWVRVFHGDRTLVSTFGPDAAARFAEWDASFAYFDSTLPPGGIVYRERGGMPGTASEPGGLLLASDAYFARLPRDPDALYAWYASTAGEPGAEFMLIVQDLETNAAPPELRAAMFRALSRTPGVTIAEAAGSVVTLQRSWTYAGESRTNAVTVDTASGLVLASTMTRGSGGSLVPDSLPDSRTVTTITPVDSAPAG